MAIVVVLSNVFYNLYSWLNARMYPLAGFADGRDGRFGCTCASFTRTAGARRTRALCSASALVCLAVGQHACLQRAVVRCTSGHLSLVVPCAKRSPLVCIAHCWQPGAAAGPVALDMDPALTKRHRTQQRLSSGRTGTISLRSLEVIEAWLTVTFNGSANPACSFRCYRRLIAMS